MEQLDRITQEPGIMKIKGVRLDCYHDLSYTSFRSSKLKR